MLVHERLRHLKTIDLFRSFREELKAFAKVACCRRIQKGEVISSPGDRADRIYFLAEGKVRIVRPGERGRRAILGFINPGELFGEHAILVEGVMENRAEAIEKGVVCHITSRTFRRLLMREPALTLRLAQIIIRRHQILENRVAGLILKDVTARLAERLLNLFKEQGIPCRHGYETETAITRQDLADLVGAARPTISSALNILKRRGLIHLVGRAICLIDREQLQAVAASPSVIELTKGKSG
ncbi:MAG: Crp/Fnr family transcriptional regulator [Candidatus Methylomirabilales bacterium]